MNQINILSITAEELEALTRKVIQEEKPAETAGNWHTVREAARLLKISEQTIRNQVKTGEIKHKKIGSVIRVLL